ncbi:MAG: potassium transporter TrkA, partial [Leptolyngbyaceae cyanobacterium SL_7_1]|nr:potassium transporter TrkA [Leptolyngbyaceae cyanobacterium SL_7_1]
MSQHFIELNQTDPAETHDSTSDSHCLVCGLGSLGQYCVVALKRFGMNISAIDLTLPQSWEVPDLPDLLENLVIGDCRQPSVLQQVQIHQCRSVLLVTNNERINIEAAFAIRLLNPTVRLVVRSAEQNLNRLLDQQLGNFAAFELAALPANALAIAALANGTQGLITLDGQLLRVVQQSIDPSHRWCDRRLVHELNTRTRRVLSHNTPSDATLPFHHWQTGDRILAGDTVTYIEITQGLVELVQPTSSIQSPRAQYSLQRRWQIGHAF